MNNHAYQFLAFFKIMNVLHERGGAQTAWINGAIPKLTERLALDRLAELRKTEKGLGRATFTNRDAARLRMPMPSRWRIRTNRPTPRG